MPTSNPYHGSIRHLLIALDIGTSYSAASYCLLDPNQVPNVDPVTRFPGREDLEDESPRVPTVLYYNKGGHFQVAGAEAETPEAIARAQEEAWVKARWFKLHFCHHSATSSSSIPHQQIKLPHKKTDIVILGDFFRELNDAVIKFIKGKVSLEDYSDISSWDELLKTATYIISHPNDWEGVQKAKYKDAILHAGLVLNTPEGKSRIVFTSEGEASLHYLLYEDSIENPSPDQGFIVANLGGGTLDFSAYAITSKMPPRRLATPRCKIQGSALATEEAREYIKECLENAEDSDLVNMVQERKFELNEEQVTKFFDFFEESIEAAFSAVMAQKRESTTDITTVYLVGGFSSNPYASKELDTRLTKENLKVIQSSEGNMGNDVAQGLILHYLTCRLILRQAKATYLVRKSVPYDPGNKKHFIRKHKVYTTLNGEAWLAGHLVVVLEKGTKVRGETAFRHPFIHQRQLDNAGSSQSSTVNLFAYTGHGPLPEWDDDESLAPNTLIEVYVDTIRDSDLQSTAKTVSTAKGKEYVQYNYTVKLLFGGPKMKVQVCTNGPNGDKTVTKYSLLHDESDDADGRA